jgi:hypothetical protein
MEHFMATVLAIISKSPGEKPSQLRGGADGRWHGRVIRAQFFLERAAKWPSWANFYIVNATQLFRMLMWGRTCSRFGHERAPRLGDWSRRFFPFECLTSPPRQIVVARL